MGLVFSTAQAAEAPALAPPARPGAMVPPPPLPSGPLAADLSKARKAVLMQNCYGICFENSGAGANRVWRRS
jgi:hypothetical protein